MPVLGNEREDVTLDDGSSSEEGGPPNPNNGNDRIRRLEEETMRNRIRAEMLQDPDYYAVMQAKQSGRAVKVIALAADGSDPTQRREAQPPEEPLKDLDFETASDKDKHAYTLKSVEKMLKEIVPKMVESATGPLSEQMKKLGGFVQTTAEERFSQDVKRLTKKYPDFNNYLDLMTQIQSKNPGLTLEEIYGVAKGRSGSQVTSEHRTQSERPNQQTISRPSAVPQRESKPKNDNGASAANRVSFREMLQKAADKVSREVDAALQGSDRSVLEEDDE